MAGGRFTTPTELCYSPVKRECLAVVGALQEGCLELLVVTQRTTSHSVFRKPLGEIENPRLLSLVEKTLWFNFTKIHVPRKWNNGPDYISRHKNISIPMVMTNGLDCQQLLRFKLRPPTSGLEGLLEKSLLAVMANVLSHEEWDAFLNTGHEHTLPEGWRSLWPPCTTDGATRRPPVIWIT